MPWCAAWALGGRYASLFFIVGIDEDENELMALEVIHRYVEALDRYFGNVRCRQRAAPHAARCASST